MKTMIALIALTVLSSSAFATSLMEAAKEHAQGLASVDLIDQNLLIVEVEGKAAELLFFSMKVAPYESFGPDMNEPSQIRETRGTSCTRSLEKDFTSKYRCKIVPNLK